MITIIFGGNGKGKSSLMNHFLNESAFDAARIREGYREIDRLNEEYGIFMPKPKHLTYLNGTAVFRKFRYNPRANLELDPGRLGIQAEAPEGVKCQHILPFATLGIDEAQTWFASRDKEAGGNYVFSFFEKHRHNNLDIYMSTTRAMLIDKRIRELACGIHVKERTIKFDRYGGMHINWYVDCIDVGEIDAYLDAAPKERKQYCSREKITCDYDVFKIYDPESQKHLFYEGFENMDFNVNYGI